MQVKSRWHANLARPLQMNWFAPLLVGGAFIGLWYAIIALLQIPPYLLPPPHGIVRAAGERWESLNIQAMHTFVAAVAGFALSAIVGIVVAIAITQFNILRRGLYPYTAALQTVPVVAVAPIIVVWLGAGKPAIIAISFVVSVFPVIANTSLGLSATDQNLHDLLDLYDASPLQKLLKLRLPHALPNIVGGLRISSGLAIIGAILGEFVAGMGGLQGGIGYVITVAARLMDMEYLFAAVAASVLMGMITLWGVDRGASYLLRHWRES